MDPHAGLPVGSLGQPLGAGRAVMIMIHGRNAAPRNILELAAAFPHPDFTFLAPAAAGNTWYPYSFLSPIEENEPGITSGIATIHRLVGEVEARGIPKSRIILLGFSQGACLTTTYAVRHAGTFGGVVGYSGGLIGPPGTTWVYPGAFNGTPVYLGCSDVDAHIPKERVDETEAVFQQMGASVTKQIFPGMGHLVNADEIAFTRTLMARVAESA